MDGMGALSRGLTTPRVHSLNIHMEGVAQGPKLDACLVLFIRRVFEEIDKASKSKDVLSSACKVLSGESLILCVCVCVYVCVHVCECCYYSIHAHCVSK